MWEQSIPNMGTIYSQRGNVVFMALALVVSGLGTGSFRRWHWQFLALALYKRSRSSRSSRSARLLEMLDNLGILVDIEILVYIGALVYLGTLAYIAKKKGSAFRQIPLWL